MTNNLAADSGGSKKTRAAEGAAQLAGLAAVKAAQDAAALNGRSVTSSRLGGDSAVSSTKEGGRKVTYIGNGGAKQTGTVGGSGGDGASKVKPGGTPSWYSEQLKLYRKMYEDQTKANNAAGEAAIQQAEKENAAQVESLREQYRSTNRQLYRDYMERRRTLPQQLAAMGYSGGLTESGMLRLASSYGEGLNENERARLAQEAGFALSLDRQRYEARAKTDEANRQARQQLYARQAALNEDIWKNRQQRANTMAASGEFSELGALGFSKSEIKYLRDIWKKTHPELA